MCDCDGERPEFFEARRRKARKRHKCCECLRVIKPGEYYDSYSGKWDGRFDEYKTCQDCLDFVKWLGLDCYCFTLLMDYADERDGPEHKAFLDRRQENFERLQFERVFRDFSRLHV